MKKINQFVFAIIAILITVNVNAQDNIFLKTGDEIQAKILEVGHDEIKYKKFDYQDGPTYTLKKSEIFMVKYKNGSKDIFESVVNGIAPKQTELKLISGSRLFLTYVSTEGKRNVDGSDAVGMLKSYIEGKTTCIVVNSKEEADFIVKLQVKKSAGRKAKIDIIHVATDKMVFESKWRKGSSAVWNGYSGSRQAIGEVVKELLLDEYPEIGK